MAISGSTGVKIYIGGQGVLASESSWVEIGEIENAGEFGDQFEAIRFLSLSDGRVRKLKGTADAGTLSLVVGHDPNNAGQTALKAAAADTGSVDYNFKVELNDAPAGSAPTPTTFTFEAFVMGSRINVGAANAVVTMSAALELNSAITVAAPTTGD